MAGNASRSRPRFGPAPVLPLLVGAFQIVGTYFAGLQQPGRRPFDAVAFLLLAAGPAALMFRRRRPVIVLVVVLAATLGYYLIGYPRGPIFLALIVAFVGAVLAGRRAAAGIIGGVGYVSFLWLGHWLGREPSPSFGESAALGAWLVALLTMAEIARARRERAAEIALTHAEESRRRASEERLRIARELHDVLAHNISLINVQAGTALHLMDARPEQARTALTAIKQASGEALRELRSALDVLRQGHGEAPRLPASGLAQLGDLVARTEAAGLSIRVVSEGRTRPLPAGVDLAAFRIVQEALTNVTRHAGPATAMVRIVYGERNLVVQVDDDGVGAPGVAQNGGNGITGMRQRAVALGGELYAGARPEGGFRVLARLPLEPPSSRDAS
ncbi:sensor histidine kinase [soil metagenome]